MRLNDKVALVTGGATGIGAAVVRRFVKEGARVAITDVRDEEGNALAKSLGGMAGGVHFAHLDVANESQWQGVVAEVLEKFGALHILVNNAGIYRRARLEEISSQQWDQMMAVNAKGVFLGMKAVVDAMERSNGGAIVNLSSVAGLIGSQLSTDYNASKGAVRMLTKSVALQYARRGIRCNSVHPAPIATPMGDEAMLSGEARARRLDDIPMGRVGTPDEVANAILFLASDEASYMTGSELVVDGGLTAK